MHNESRILTVHPPLSAAEKHYLRSRQSNQQLLLDTIKQHLRCSPSVTLSIQEMAKKLCMSERTLSRRLQHTGKRYRQLHSEILLEKAAELLANDNLTISDVARALGYENASNFCKAFKNWAGISPGKFRSTSNGKTAQLASQRTA